MSKITKIPSEIRNFFTGKRINPAFSKFMTLLEGMRISDKDLGGKKRENCQLTNLQLFQIILILPFMAVPGFSHYAGSSISKLLWGIERSGFFNGREKWAKGFENQRV